MQARPGLSKTRCPINPATRWVRVTRSLPVLLTVSLSGAAVYGTDGGSGSALDPYTITTSDSSLNISGAYYTYKNLTTPTLDFGSVAFIVGQSVGGVHLVLDTAGITVKALAVRVGYVAGQVNYGDISNGSTLQAGGGLAVGFNGTGNLTVHDGGRIINGGGASYVGYNGTGNVSLSGGSSWTSGGSLRLGYSSGAVGNFALSGSGTYLTSSGSITVAQSGTGTLTIDDNALVAAGAVSSPLGTGAGGAVQLGSGYLAIRSAALIEPSTLVTTYNIDVFRGGSYVDSTAADLTTEYFNGSNPWSSSPLYSSYSGLDLTGFTLVSAIPEPASYAVVSGLGALGLGIVLRRRRAGRAAA